MLYRPKQFIKKLIPSAYHQDIIALRNNFTSLRYYGKRVECPCCGRTSRKFLDYDEATPNTMCPKCWSHARHRLLWLYLNNKTNFFSENIKILHFAPEYIFQKHFSSFANLDYISADLTSPLAKVKIDITDIPYKNDVFDVLLCSHVLEHVLDDRKALKELFRVLKPGGWSILQVPINYNKHETLEDPNIVSPEDRKLFYGESDHMRYYGLDYKERLEEAGFGVVVDGYVKELDPVLINKYGLDEKENIYFCTKPR